MIVFSAVAPLPKGLQKEGAIHASKFRPPAYANFITGYFDADVGQLGY
jgi:hypothetical protein